MARPAFALATAMLVCAFLAIASALPIVENHSGVAVAGRQGDDHSDHDHDHGDHKHGDGHDDKAKADSKSKSEKKESSDVTTAPTASTAAAAAAATTAATTAAAASESADSTVDPEGEGADGTDSSPDPTTTDSPAAGSTTSRDEEADSSASPDGDDDSACFPANARVELEDGSSVAMDKLSIGDSVKVGPNQYSKVFMFTHKLSTGTHKFVVLNTESGASLSLTKGHYIYADGSLVAASQVKVGSSVSLGNGQFDTVVSVGSADGQGLYNPQTVNGNVVVNNVLASTYTTAVEPVFAHALLAPFRFLNTLGLQFTSLESGGGILANVAPRGAAF